MGLVEAAPLNKEQDVQDVPVVVETDQPPVEVPTERPVEEEVQPQPAPAPQPVVVKHPVGCENYRDLISQYAWNVEVALKVMRAESGCNPSAIGDRHIPPVSCGLFQVRTLPGRPSCSALQDPATNIAYAYKLYQASGWQPWSVCKNGKVSCY